MTEFPPPGLPARESTVPTSAERLAALRNKPANKRRKPARTSKILAAGLSTTALFGMVTAMGWSASTDSAQSASAPTTIAAPVAPAPPTTTVPAPAPEQSTDDDAAPTAPTTAAPVVIPTATAVPVQNAPVRTASNTVTKTSG